MGIRFSTVAGTARSSRIDWINLLIDTYFRIYRLIELSIKLKTINFDSIPLTVLLLKEETFLFAVGFDGDGTAGALEVELLPPRAVIISSIEKSFPFRSTTGISPFFPKENKYKSQKY